MKKFFVLSVLSLSLAAVSGQTASAWSSCKFGVGLNFEFCGGGNNVLWGAYHSAPAPMNGGMPGYPGYAAGPIDGFGMADDMGAPVVSNLPSASGTIQPVQHDWRWGGNMGYQPVNYYYPSAGSTYYAPPMYGYGR